MTRMDEQGELLHKLQGFATITVVSFQFLSCCLGIPLKLPFALTKMPHIILHLFLSHFCPFRCVSVYCLCDLWSVFSRMDHERGLPFIFWWHCTFDLFSGKVKPEEIRLDEHKAKTWWMFSSLVEMNRESRVLNFREQHFQMAIFCQNSVKVKYALSISLKPFQMTNRIFCSRDILVCLWR